VCSRVLTTLRGDKEMSVADKIACQGPWKAARTCEGVVFRAGQSILGITHLRMKVCVPDSPLEAQRKHDSASAEAIPLTFKSFQPLSERNYKS